VIKVIYPLIRSRKSKLLIQPVQIVGIQAEELGRSCDVAAGLLGGVEEQSLFSLS